MAWTAADIPDQTGRVAVVTGANSGIGLEAARELARKGAHVVLACRSASRGTAAVADIRGADSGASVELAALDLADLGTVRAFAEWFAAHHPRLDLLVNNAGVMMLPRGRTADGFELQFGINHLGHFALTGLLLPHLLASPGSRIVTVSSYAHKVSWIDFDNLDGAKRDTKMGAYCRSKLANLLFHFELQRRLSAGGHQVLAAAAHPGWASTNLMGGVMGVATRILAQSTESGALPTVYAATAPDVEPGGYFGPTWFDMFGAPRRAVPWRQARDGEVAKRLWAASEELTGVHYLG